MDINERIYILGIWEDDEGSLWQEFRTIRQAEREMEKLGGRVTILKRGQFMADA